MSPSQRAARTARAVRAARGKLSAPLAAVLVVATAMGAAAQVHGVRHQATATAEQSAPISPPPAGVIPGPHVAGQLIPAAGQAPRYACAAPAPGVASCLAVVDPRPGASPASTPADSLPQTGIPDTNPYLAAQLRAAYKLPSKVLGARQTIAIVDAYDDPTAASDLAAYRAANHMPACSAAFQCLRKVAQDGSTNYPQPDPSAGWEVEESLDLDMAAAICPNCTLLLVEAADSSVENLGKAEDEAVNLGATVISNSYGAQEYSGEQADARHWDHKGVVITASTGDDGFGTEMPAVFGTVVAVGGTTLYHAAGARGWSEQAWSGAGSGCSAYVAKPTWQHDADCAKRSVADVAAVADPDTPVWIYDTYQTGGDWGAVGGTSVAAPIIAGVYALAGNATSISPGSRLAANASALFDTAGGSTGYCGGGYLCAGKPGYDGPTGWGTPDGIGAF